MFNKEDNKETFKETEFDSSVATLYRIDALIKLLHETAIGKHYGENSNEMYLRTLDRLFMETQTKMTDDEFNNAKKYQTQIKQISKNNDNSSTYSF